MKNKTTSAIIVGTVLLSSLLVGTTAFAQSVPSQGAVGYGYMQRAPGVRGTVASINGNSLTVTSQGYGQSATPTTYTVDATNATVTKAGAASSVSAIAVGDMVSVQGSVSGTSVTATSIRDGVGGGMMGGRGMGMRAPGVFGSITSVSGNTITVTSKAMPNGGAAVVYIVDATNATVTKAGAASSVSALAVGDNVMVEGTVNGTSVTATAIRDGINDGEGRGRGVGMMVGRGARGGAGTSTGGTILPQGNGQPVVAGAVTSVSGSTFAISNKAGASFTIDATSATVTKAGAASSVGAIAVGDTVVVQGTVNGSAVAAVSVMDQGTAPVANTSVTNAQGIPTPAQHRGFLGMLGSFFGHFFGF